MARHPTHKAAVQRLAAAEYSMGIAVPEYVRAAKSAEAAPLPHTAALGSAAPGGFRTGAGASYGLEAYGEGWGRCNGV